MIKQLIIHVLRSPDGKIVYRFIPINDETTFAAHEITIRRKEGRRKETSTVMPIEEGQQLYAQLLRKGYDR